jgi:Family of unknown function (DUF6134)
MLRLLVATAVLVAGWASARAADSPYGPQASYAIYRGGLQIGRHTVSFQHKGALQVVTADCEIDVKALGVSAYRYVHHNREEWAGDQLQSLRATTDDNGQKFTVTAERHGGVLVVERVAPTKVSTAALLDQGYQGPDVSRQSLPAGIMPTSQWNIRQVQQTTLLNTQLGTVAKVHVTPMGRETVQTANGSVTAMRYRYAGDLRMDQWFDDRGRWVKGAFAAFDGSTIEYILQE